jgi:hypothetical protein
MLDRYSKRGVLVKSSTARARAQAAKDKALKEKGMAAMGNLKVGDDLLLDGSTIVGGSLEQLLAALLSRSCPGWYCGFVCVFLCVCVWSSV